MTRLLCLPVEKEKQGQLVKSSPHLLMGSRFLLLRVIRKCPEAFFLQAYSISGKNPTLGRSFAILKRNQGCGFRDGKRKRLLPLSGTRKSCEDSAGVWSM